MEDTGDPSGIPAWFHTFKQVNTTQTDPRGIM
jgi:hypothetical protein